jgi:hypothetical protein
METVIDLHTLGMGDAAPPPCGCPVPSGFCTSLIQQPWMRPKDSPANLCHCRKWYWSVRAMEWRKAASK